MMNAPNLLTMLRLLSVPVLAVCLFIDDGTSTLWRDVAAIVFVLASLTDFADGALARRWDQVTRFGRIMDPIADKALVGVALIGLALLGDLAWWIAIVILVREVAVTIVRSRVSIPVRGLGKAKTVAQLVAIAMYLAVVPGVPWWQPVAQFVMAIAVVLTVVTGVMYLRQAVRA